MRLAKVNEKAEGAAQHTPGPWNVVDMKGPGRRLVLVRDPRNCYVAELQEMDALTYRDGQLEANARLIAAAPALLAALEGLFEHCAMIHKNWGEGDNTRQADDAQNTARSVIAAARGEK